MSDIRGEMGRIGTPWEDRVKRLFNRGETAPAAKEEEPVEESTEEHVEAAPAESESAPAINETPVEEPAPVEAATEESVEEPVAPPPPSLDPNIQALIEQNKRLTEMLGRTQSPAEQAEAEEADGLTADQLMDEEVRRDPAKFAAVINRAIQQGAERQARLHTAQIESQQRMERFRNTFYQRPDNKRFAALRDTPLDPLNIAAQQAVAENPELRNLPESELMDELTRRVGKMGSLLDQYAGKPGAAPAPRRVNQPGAKPGTTHSGPAEQLEIEGTRRDTNRARAGIKEYMSARYGE